MDKVIEISDNEYQALCLSLNKTRLHKRLTDAKAVLESKYRKMFKPGIFKLAEKALYSDTPFGYRLQWRTRQYPELLEAYDNQQTNIGSVYLERLPTAGHPADTAGETGGE